MAPIPELRTADVLALRKVVTRSDVERTTLLAAAAARPIRSPKTLREWHDLLLYILAFPRNAEDHGSAHCELTRVASLASRMTHGNATHRQALCNSGMSGTLLQSSFSLTIVRWMLARWPGRVALHSLECSVDELRAILLLAVHPGEAEALDIPLADTAQLLHNALGPPAQSHLERLVQLLEQMSCPEPMRAMLFDRMQVHLHLDGSAPDLNLTQVRGPSGPRIHYPKGTDRSVDLMVELRRTLDPPIRLRKKELEHMVDTGRIVLCSLLREIDPITHAGHVELHGFDRGLRVALYSLRPAKRLPYDSYVGFMAFRNGLPMAYGGAWMFPGRSKVGINIFPAYRGGDSAWTFAQVLRLYHQKFEVTRFEAESYQLGHGNSEGLRSGAYWFYYRLGFRPTVPGLAETARNEQQKMQRMPQHRTSQGLLARLAAGGLELRLTDTAPDRPIDTADLPLAVQAYVANTFKGDRTLALASSLRKVVTDLAIKDLRRWTMDERLALENWSIALSLVPAMGTWPASVKRNVVKAIRAKSNRTEEGHLRALQRCPELLEALRSTCRLP